jgi:hypothetical protein
MPPTNGEARPLDADEIDRLLAEHWDAMVRRAAGRVATRVVRERRITDVNRFLAAAAGLMSLQCAWGAVTLMRLVN